MNMGIDFSQWEIDQGQLFIYGSVYNGEISSHTLPYPYIYLNLAWTKTQVDLLVQEIYNKTPEKLVEVSRKYLSGSSLKAYLEEAYGEDLELFAKEGEVRLCVSNLKTPVNEKIMSFDHDKRRPGYLMRGKSVTEEQAMELFIRSEWTTQEHLDSVFHLSGMNFCTGFTCFAGEGRKFSSSVRSWIGFDGMIGNDGITQKYPNMVEFIEELTELAGLFPYLDLMILVANNDEWEAHFLSDHGYDELVVDLDFYLKDTLCKELTKYEKQNPENFPDFFEDLSWKDWGFVVKDGMVEVLDYTQISEKFCEYYEKYDVNLKNGNPVTSYSWTDWENLPHTVYHEDTLPKYFTPCGEGASDSVIEAWLEGKNQEFIAKYL